MIVQQLESKVKNRVYLKQTERANKNKPKRSKTKMESEVMRKWTKETPFGKPNASCLCICVGNQGNKCGNEK